MFIHHFITSNYTTFNVYHRKKPIKIVSKLSGIVASATLALQAVHLFILGTFVIVALNHFIEMLVTFVRWTLEPQQSNRKNQEELEEFADKVTARVEKRFVSQTLVDIVKELNL